jgi:polar amino acid transport system substrate-binding protein
MNTRVASHYWTHASPDADAPVLFDPGLPHAKGYHYLASIKHPELIEQFRRFVENNGALLQQLKAR